MLYPQWRQINIEDNRMLPAEEEEEEKEGKRDHYILQMKTRGLSGFREREESKANRDLNGEKREGEKER